MKRFFKKIAGFAFAAFLAFGMTGCIFNVSDTAAPVFSVASGKVDNGTIVKITCATEGAKIYYTTDGSTPTESAIAYTAALKITESVTIKAVAVKEGLNDSEVTTASYSVKERAASPEFSVDSGDVLIGTSVTLTCASEGAKIYYTTDGSTPTESSAEYTEALSITEAVTINAFAVCEGTYDSEISSAKYTIISYSSYGWYQTPIDAETGLAATSSSTYIYFGVFPKTVVKQSEDGSVLYEDDGETVLTIDETDSETIGANTYYKGSDGEYYAKVTENPYKTSYTYSDNSTVSSGSTRYFKVEPIKWKVLTTDYNSTGKALLLAEDILTANVKYYASETDRTINGNTVYANNYKYSTMRAYLNGSYESDDTQTQTYADKGFLQTAFTATAQGLIATTEVDNSAESTSDAKGILKKADGTDSSNPYDYTCANTSDKIFLLSEKEVTTTDYGFEGYNSSGSGNARIRVTTDYAKANYACQSANTGNGGLWLLRSPHWQHSYYVWDVNEPGSANHCSNVDNIERGIVPALCISLE